MSYLSGRQSNPHFLSHPTSIGDITGHIKELIAKEDSYARKREQLITERQNEDMGRHLLRKEEDEKYNAVLTSRGCDDEHIRKKRATEDNDIDYNERAIEREIVNIF